MLFLEADTKGALIQSDRGVNTIPNLIDPSQNHSIILHRRVRHNTQRKRQRRYEALSLITGQERWKSVEHDNEIPGIPDRKAALFEACPRHLMAMETWPHDDVRPERRQ